MTRIALVFFSGTGNTAWVVNRLEGRLTELGDAVQIVSCEQVSPLSVDREIARAEVLGVAFPVHASWAPRNLRGYLARLPAARDVPLFVIAVPAIFGGDAAWYAARPLASKGYVPFLYANVFMPNNLYPVPRPDQVPRIVGRAAAKVDRLAPLIHERRRHTEGVHPLGWLGGYLQRWGFAPFEGRLQRYLFAGEACTGCGWCVANCPTGAIEMIEGSIHFRDGCILCTRCFHYCPEHAVQYTRATQNQVHFRRYAGPSGAGWTQEEGT